MQTYQAPQSPNLVADVISGCSIAGLLLPEAVAYSGIGNLPPQAGVIALFAGLACYGLLGRSRFAIVSATSSSAALIAASIGTMAGTDLVQRILLSGALVMLAGVVFILASLAKLGSATDFIAKPVLRGFAFGLASVIIIKQLPILFGVPTAGGDVAHVVAGLVQEAGNIRPIDLTIGVAALVLLFFFARFRKVPGALIVIALGVVVNLALNLDQYGVTEVGAIRLDSLSIHWPELERTQWLRLGELSMAMVLIIYAESSGSIRSFAVKYGETTDPNRDLMALGVANLVSGLFQGLPVGAGYSATSANEAAGAQSRWSGIVAIGAVLLIIVAILQWIARAPAAILAAIVIHAVSHTLNPAVFKPYFVWKRDRIVAISAIVAVLAFGVLDGLLAAVGVSLAMMLRGLAKSRVATLGRLGVGHDFVDRSVHPEAHCLPNVLILRPESPVFFANVDRIFHHVRDEFVQFCSEGGDSSRDQKDPATAVVLSLEETPDVDGTTLEALQGLATDIARLGGRLFLARLKQPVIDALLEARIEALPPSSIQFFSVDDAVSSAAGLTST